jgi:hypothetical protein
LLAESHSQRYPDGTESTYSAQRQDLVWWVLAPNPFVVVADAAPPVSSRGVADGVESSVDDYDVLSAIGRGVRQLRQPPSGRASALNPLDPASPANLPVWPYGLAFDILLGVGAVAITAKRLHTPTRKLPPATRIA